MIIGSRTVLKTVGRETGLWVRVPLSPLNIRLYNIHIVNYYVEDILLRSSEAEHLTVNQGVGIS